ncbi:tubulin-specific chaperone c [Aspergillus arachidicola]|uniref:Tubulin-specific chaperone c n=1 Tax=Aspergillus arachidicola TaxID=656916 RepID=A0A2G7G023_9EURO|nr:tubulin-specific chaperone c [Aspergillus arachidicola]
MSETEIRDARRPSQAENQTILKSEIPLKERFFRYFQHEITALQEQMDRLADTSLVGGERTDATDHCLAGIARLSNEVKDAASYIPTYDQRIYAEAIKALQDKLVETRATVEPRPKFSFKTKKNASAVSLSDAANIVYHGRSMPGYLSPGTSSVDSSAAQTPNYPSTPLNEPDRMLQPRAEIAPTSFPAIPTIDVEDIEYKSKSSKGRAFAATAVSSVSVNNHVGLHIMLPPPDRRLRLTIKGVKESLLVCGQINGPAHITDVENSTIVVTCRQFRMHNCSNVDVYLSASSNPIIEDCTNIRFAQIPRVYALDHDHPDSEDRWSQVEDFKWIKPEPSPNWSLIPRESAVPEEVWAEIVPGGPGWSLDDILRAINITN